MMIEAKPSNPKDGVAVDKLDLGLIPSSALAAEALAFTEGALKYGRYNWRIAGVSASVYFAAAQRHLQSWWNGEECDPKTGVPHLGSARACLGIILDAEVCGMLADDRPPMADVGGTIRGSAQRVKALQQLFIDHHPHQYTIADTPLLPRSTPRED